MRKIDCLTIVVLWTLQGVSGILAQENSSSAQNGTQEQRQKLGGIALVEAATESESSDGERNVTFGIKAGINWSWLNHFEQKLINREYRPGYTLGGIIEIPIVQRLGLIFGLSFSVEQQRHSFTNLLENMQELKYRLKSQYLDLPVGINIYPLPWQRWYLNTNLTWRTVLQAKEEYIA